MVFVKCQGNQFKIDGEIAKNHEILDDHFKFDVKSGVFYH